jgi:hypothetical protein
MTLKGCKESLRAVNDHRDPKVHLRSVSIEYSIFWRNFVQNILYSQILAPNFSWHNNKQRHQHDSPVDQRHAFALPA